MSNNINEILGLIGKNLNDLINNRNFSEWQKSQHISDGDYIAINNSFVYRKPLIKTSKNEKYISLVSTTSGFKISEARIISPSSFDQDFKHFSANSKTFPSSESLNQSIENEIGKLGKLMFILIGELVDDPYTIHIENSQISELTFDHSRNEQKIIENNGRKAIVVNQIIDPESVLNLLQNDIKKIIGENILAFEKSFLEAFKKLQDETRIHLHIPRPSEKPSNSFIGFIRKSLSDQRSQYALALQKCIEENDENGINKRDVLRIAYNFASDALKILQLLVSICDLKPLLFWMTINSHHEVAEAFRNLPWVKSEKKASFERYTEIINGARNRSFHNLIMFDRTIDVDLQGIQVNARKLTLLPPFSQKKSFTAFDYEDREMVEVLQELTRAPEIAVPIDFWQKNLDVMRSFEQLLVSTEESMNLLNAVRL